jgi:hypothetical protein
MPLGTVVDVSLATEHALDGRPPRLLLYGVAVTDLNGNRVEPQGLRFLMDSGDLVRWARRRPDKAFRGVREFVRERVVTPVPLAYHADGLRFWAATRLDEVLPGFSAPTARKSLKNLDDSAVIRGREGYLPRGRVYPEGRLSVRKAQGRQEPPFIYLNRYDVRGHLSYLQGLLEWARARDVEVVLVEMPMSADVEREFPREFATFRAVLRETARAHGLRLLRPTRQRLGLTDAEFLDDAHLNADGVRRFSTWLRNTLETAEARR